MPIYLIREDIRNLPCDAIVLAAEDPAAEREEEQELISKATDWPCRYIVRLPIDGKRDEGGVRSFYTRALLLARKHRCKTVALPLLSTDGGGEKARRVATEAIGAFLGENEMNVSLVLPEAPARHLDPQLEQQVRAYIRKRFVEEEPSAERQARKISAPSGSVPGPKVQAARIKQSQPKASRTADCAPMATAEPPLMASVYSASAGGVKRKESLDERLSMRDKGFADTLFDYIDAKGLTDVECYKRANVDRKTFSKIKCNKSYRPSKQTVLSFAIALELTLEETSHLLNTVGMSLSHSSIFDIIVEFFIENGKYDIWEINETLLQFDQVLLGA